ncbi:MAG: hypothetical protein V3S03_03310 [Vicinamibacteria bacterium]
MILRPPRRSPRQAEHDAARRWGTPLGREVGDEQRAELVRYLRELADDVEQQGFASEPYALAVVLLGRDDSAVGWTGFGTWEEIHQAERCLRERVFGKRWAMPGEKPRHRNIVAAETAARFKEATERREYQAAHPFACELEYPCPGRTCGQRFRTNRGRKMHEARAWIHRARQDQ